MAKEAPAEACPVDHSTREAWLKTNPNPEIFPGTKPKESRPIYHSPSIDQTPSPKPGFLSNFTFWSSNTSKPDPVDTSKVSSELGVDRVVSTIPRASPVDKTGGVQPANSEKESGVSEGGNWIYPSEKMFFEAMKRKGHSGEPADMKTIVPIHNAVNERAWKEIKEWERPWGSKEKCGGPKLYSFLGLSKNMTPKARINTIMGYTAPFDRHDWVIDRCGTKIEYVIDFYKGSDKNANGRLNFYLDVRPKLNSWEGWKMRAARLVGIV
ncbi:cytochrome c1 heme lyase-like protein [Bisporella sp. PMI_857]|nr:cytochrome c1 heme lyase-like protein [Bisporella sp. PMI_857]